MSLAGGRHGKNSSSAHRNRFRNSRARLPGESHRSNRSPGEDVRSNPARHPVTALLTSEWREHALEKSVQAYFSRAENQTISDAIQGRYGAPCVEFSGSEKIECSASLRL